MPAVAHVMPNRPVHLFYLDASFLWKVHQAGAAIRNIHTAPLGSAQQLRLWDRVPTHLSAYGRRQYRQPDCRGLIISINTVGNHVRNILNKTGTSNRTEATAYAVRRGLASDENSPP